MFRRLTLFLMIVCLLLGGVAVGAQESTEPVGAPLATEEVTPDVTPEATPVVELPAEELPPGWRDFMGDLLGDVVSTLRDVFPLEAVREIAGSLVEIAGYALLAYFGSMLFRSQPPGSPLQKIGAEIEDTAREGVNRARGDLLDAGSRIGGGYTITSEGGTVEGKG